MADGTDDEFLPSLEDELGIDIVIQVEDGEVIGVTYRGKEVRAMVMDYDVDFPCVATGLAKDDEGNYYKQIVV